MEDVKAAIERTRRGDFRRGRGSRSGGRQGFGVAEEHENIPYTELGRERDGVVEEGEVPSGAEGGGGDSELSLK